MHTYTLDEARGIVMRCAKQYEKNLLGKKYLVIYRDRVDNEIKTDMPSQVLAIFSKEEGETVYKNVRYVAKGVNLNNVKLPERINKEISLEKYKPL